MFDHLSDESRRSSLKITLPSAVNNTPFHPVDNIPDDYEIKKISLHLQSKDEDQISSAQNQLFSKEKISAARIIQNAWVCYRCKQMFQLLKHAICAAENLLSHEILRKVCPRESKLLNDKCIKSKIRFRFGGKEFPPMIYFKIYLCRSENHSFTYFSGKQCIKPASEAARDACDLMGPRQFLQQVVQDEIQINSHQITDKIDVTTFKDFMKYTSYLDELPSYMGGRENHWRQLSLIDLPRQTIFYDIVEFLYSKNLSSRLKDELPALLIKPQNQDALNEQLNIISQIRPISGHLQFSRRQRTSGNHISSSRCSKQAMEKVNKMKAAYLKYMPEKPISADASFVKIKSKTLLNNDIVGDLYDIEDEALFEWTQQLSYDDLICSPFQD